MEALVILSPMATVVGVLFIIAGHELKSGTLKQTGYALVAFAVITASILLLT